MEQIIQENLAKDTKMAGFLKQNSNWIKELNRDSNNYRKFTAAMKEKYHVKMTDKISDAMDNIDLISSVLDVLK